MANQRMTATLRRTKYSTRVQATLLTIAMTGTSFAQSLSSWTSLLIPQLAEPKNKQIADLMKSGSLTNQPAKRYLMLKTFAMKDISLMLLTSQPQLADVRKQTTVLL